MRLTVGLAILAACLASACDGADEPRWAIAGADPHRGEALIVSYQCGACHTVPGVRGANGVVAPPLIAFARRSVVAGMLPNTPDNLALWLMHPQRVVPGNAMPEMGISEAQAHDIAAYLYTLR